MICKKCGCEVKEGALFCGNCGAEMTESGQVAGKEKRTKKKMSLKKKILIGVVSFLVVVGGVGLIWGEEIVNKLMFAMPADTQLHSAYYNFAKKVGKESGVFLDEYKKSFGMDAYSTSGMMAIRVSDAVKSMLGIEIDEIDRIYMDYEVIQEDYDYGINLDLGLGDTHILALDIIVDYEEGTMTMLFPELSDEAIVADMEYDMGIDVSDMEDFDSQMEEYAGIMATVLPEGAAIEEFIPEYVETIIKAIDVVEREEATLTVGGVSQEATALVVNFDEKMVEKVSKAVYKKLAKDSEFKSYMKGIYEMSLAGEEFDEDTWNEEYDELLQGLEKDLSKLKDEAIFQEGVKFVTWINSDNQIIGIELADTFAWKSAEDGNKVATEIAIVDSGMEVLRIVSEGTKSGDSFFGDVTLYAEGEEFIVFEVAKWINTEKKFECDVKLVLNANMMEQLTGEVWQAGDITLHLTGEGDEETASMDFAVLLGDNEMAAIEFSSNGIEEDVHIERPSKEVDYSNMDEWAMNIDPTTILDNLEKAGFSKLEILGYLYEFGLY